MSEQRKCRAKGGPANCTNPNCPERVYHFSLPSEFKQLAELKKPTPPAFGAWTEKDTVLFKTIHGSRLYNLNHANSDDDYYIVTPTVKAKRLSLKNAKHKIDGNLDTLSVDFATFVLFSQQGKPQALEAMFSKKSSSPFFEDYRKGWFASDPEVVDRYIRTIHAFSMDEGDKQVKYRRHALRLSLNLDELVHTGRFNPTLSDRDARYVKKAADYSKNDYLKELNAVNPFDLDWTHEDA